MIAHLIDLIIMLSGTQLTKGLKRCNTCELCFGQYYTQKIQTLYYFAHFIKTAIYMYIHVGAVSMLSVTCTMS